MLVWVEQFLQVLAIAATIFTTLTVGFKNIKDLRIKQKNKKRKRRFL
ncbi:hypothetical protein [Priestia koreensis]|nr:hypothetical protein [Priestia koreensis]MCM3005302.1 hypothetical protein [Priestia koreensis]